jgi:hypothetical protein
MINPLIQELAKTKAKVVQLEQAIVKELASLPAAYGFASTEEFVSALHTAKGGSGRSRKPSAPKARKRAVITDSVRSKVKKLFKAGRSGSQIAKAVGISLPSVQNIKKAFGLVKSHKKAAPKPSARRVQAKNAAVPKARKKPAARKKASIPAPKAIPVAAEPVELPAV